MKKYLLITFVVLIVNLTFSQSSQEMASISNYDNLVKSTITNLGGDYLIFNRNEIYLVIEKKENSYLQHYFLSNDEDLDSKSIDNFELLGEIFTEFTPKTNVPRYTSETTFNSKCPEHFIYFAIFKNGSKEFDSRLPGLLTCNEEGDFKLDYPYSDELFEFLVVESQKLNKG